MATLKMLRGFSPGKVFNLVGDSVVLGRHPECDIVLETRDVSRQHVRITRIGEVHYIEDLRSHNKTFLNDKEVTKRQKLSDGDQIKICQLLFVFQTAPQGSSGSEEPADTPEGFQMIDCGPTMSGSSIVSKMDVSTSATSPLLTVHPEVKLKAVLQIVRDLGKAVRLDEVLPKLLDNLFAIFLQADHGFIMLKDQAGGKMVPKAVKRRRDLDDQIHISRQIVNQVMARKEAILCADAATDSQFNTSESIVQFQIHSMMCVPLSDSDGQVLGVIQINATNPMRRFSSDDLEVLVSVAGQAAMAVENAQLHEQRLQAKLLERELELAHKVQLGLLPSGAPKVEGYEFVDLYQPAKYLAGDYFDYIELPGGRLAVTLADVMGKGITAALLMARLSAQVPYCLVSLPTPADAMARLNTVFCEPRWEGRFVTMVMLVLDPVQHKVTVANAGHYSPLWRGTAGKVEPVCPSLHGLPLGIDIDATYEQETIDLGPGESLTLFTDGITDAMNAREECYTEDRLRAQLARPDAEASRVRQRLLDDLNRFVGSHPQTDDICMTYLRRTV